VPKGQEFQSHETHEPMDSPVVGWCLQMLYGNQRDMRSKRRMEVRYCHRRYRVGGSCRRPDLELARTY